MIRIVDNEGTIKWSPSYQMRFRAKHKHNNMSPSIYAIPTVANTMLKRHIAFIRNR